MIGLLLLINWIKSDHGNFAAIAPVVYYKAKGLRAISASVQMNYPPNFIKVGKLVEITARG